MSLIRPVMARRLGRLVEPGGYALVAALGLALAWRGVRLGAWIAVALGLAVAAVAAMAALAWHRRRGFRAEAEAEGVVEIDEHRVAYFAPEGGGFVDLDLLTRLEIDTGGARGPVWILRHEAGPALRIPLDARGADALADLFAALPGVRLETALAARRATANARFLIWKRKDVAAG